MNQDKIQVCLDTLQFDQIEEILYINSFACVNISLYTPFSQHCFKNRRQVSQFQDYYKFMTSQGFKIYTPEFITISQSQNQCNAQMIKYVNAILDEILKRYDLMSKQSTLELLGLNDPNIELTTKEERIIPQKVMGFNTGNNGLAICCIKLTAEFVGLTTINRDPIQNFGKMYSLVEPELMGSIQIYKNQSVVPFTKLYSKSYCFKLNCLEFVRGKNEIVAGTCQGIILLYQIIYFNGIQIQECQSIQLITDHIFRINQFLEKELYLNTENQIKIIDSERYSLIGGGSVKQRLQNGWITSQNFDPINLLLFLGSNKGIILIYKRTDKLEFVNQIQFNESLYIYNLAIQKNYLYPCTHNKIPIFRYAYKDNKLKYDELAVLQTPKSEDLLDIQVDNNHILGICQNSTILQWNLSNGHINQSYSINKDLTFLTAFQENRLYISSDNDKLHIIEFE